MTTQELIKRVDYLINNGRTVLLSKEQYSDYTYFVETGQYAGFRSASLSFITGLFGQEHTYYKEFVSQVNNTYDYNVESGINILLSIRHEIEEGWLTSIKTLVTAEIFSDFLEMSEYLLNEGYKDASAVMIGSVLEEHLRLLCTRHSVDIFTMKGSDAVAKKAELLNADLTKAGIYNILQQKSITAWLDLRNKAAHGKYSEYTTEQVKLMYQGVLDFTNRVN